jgi:predicted Fe-Mo cluster-binding NifX family protein
MIVAISVWNQRIAPVFDVSRTALVCVTRQGRLIAEHLEGLPAEDPVAKIHALQGLEAEVLVCGAISRTILDLAEMYGIITFPFTSGRVETVKTAFLRGRLADSGFARPGCRRRRRIRCQNARRFIGNKNTFPDD